LCNGAHDCGGSSKQGSRRNSNFETQKAVFSPTEQIQWNNAVNEGAREARGRGSRNRRSGAVNSLRLTAVLPSCTPGACEPDEGNSILDLLSATGNAAAGVARGGAGEAAGIATGLWDTAKHCNAITGEQFHPACEPSLPSPRELERHYLRGDPFEASGRLIVGVGGVILTRRPSQGAAKGSGGNGTTRVGRWMSRVEHEAMQSTGRVQEGSGGVASVARPANPRAYERQATSGSRYVEFDVPSGSLRGGGRPDWAVIPGPNSIFHRLSGRYPEMPRATCIEWRACRR